MLATVGIGVAVMGVTGLETSSGIALVALASLVGIVGWIDDFRTLGVASRLLVDLLAAACLVVLLARDAPQGNWPGGWIFAASGAAAAVAWIAGHRNAFNFMDGIDGIAGAQAVVAGLGWCILLPPPSSIGLLGLLISTASLGLLGENWEPANVFMGDIGSGYLGFLLGGLPVVVFTVNPEVGIAGVFLTWPFVFDAGYTLLRRLRGGANVFEAHRSHLYQRLTIAGLRHRTVAGIYALLAAYGVVCAKLWVTAPAWRRTVLAAGLAIAAAGLTVATSTLERRQS